MHIEPSGEAYRAVLGAGLLDRMISQLKGRKVWFLIEVSEAVALSQEEALARLKMIKGKDGLSDALRQALSIKIREGREGSYLPRMVDTGLVTKVLLDEGDARKVLEPHHREDWPSIPYGHNAIFACAASYMYRLDNPPVHSLWVDDVRFSLVQNKDGLLVERIALPGGIWMDVDSSPDYIAQVHVSNLDSITNLNGFCRSKKESQGLEGALRNYFSDLSKHP